MSANYPQLPSGSEAGLPVPADEYAVATQGGGHGVAPVDAEEGGGPSIGRMVAALKRYSWLIVLTTIAGAAAGVAATRFIVPQYQVYATVFATPSPQGRGGPISDGALTQNAGWRDLLYSYAITDPVVRKLGLYLQPEKASDSLLFANFTVDSLGFRPGDFTLRTEQGRYTLTDKLGFVNEQGTVGDSVGGKIGFRWVPPARLLGTKSRTISFKVMTPREASLDVQRRFGVQVDDKSPVIKLALRGTAAQRPAATMNAMLAQFTDVASDLKKRQLVQQSATLGAQLGAAQAKLQDAERGLESFRVATISKPSENAVEVRSQGVAGIGGIEVTQPTISTYFANKSDYESIRRDRVTLEQIAQSLRAPNSSQAPDVILSVPTVTRDEGAIELRGVVKELNDEQTKLRQALQTYTDSTPEVKDKKRAIADLRNRVLLGRLGDYIASLRARENDLSKQVSDATRELQEIPTRTIEQGKLERERNVQADLYTRLRGAYAEANLAQQSAIPDVKVLDTAVTPLEATANTGPKVIAAAVMIGLGLGIALALLIDRLDHRFRYPDQARELGLDVLGVVPVLEPDGRQSPERVALIVEAFRSIRMNVRYASGGSRGIALGITSPGPGDGKSVVASNLALSFAEGGWRTVLIDADTRRGQLSVTFDIPNTPGLVEYLEGTSLLSEVLQPTHHDNLSVMACGTRHRRAPELLATPRMQQLIATLAGEFDVVIIDTPPLGAGTDAYAVGTACGQLAVVLRANQTNIRMAKAKLAVIRQLPIVVLGAILNEVQTNNSMYEYYSYDPDYVLAEESPAITSGDESKAVELHAGQR